MAEHSIAPLGVIGYRGDVWTDRWVNGSFWQRVPLCVQCTAKTYVVDAEEITVNTVDDEEWDEGLLRCHSCGTVMAEEIDA